MKSILLDLRQDQYLELEKIGLGAFLPLNHFMNDDEFKSVSKNMRLPSGDPFPIPVFLDVEKEFADSAKEADLIQLMYDGIKVGTLIPESIYTCNKEIIAQHVYGTSDIAHPGVARFYDLGNWFIGGETHLLKRVEGDLDKYELNEYYVFHKVQFYYYKKAELVPCLLLLHNIQSYHHLILQMHI